MQQQQQQQCFNIPFLQYDEERLMNYCCSICYEYYSLKLKPVNLICGHTMCFLCYKSLINKNIQACPECRSQFPHIQPGPNQPLISLLRQEIVFCIKQKEGCKFQGKFEKLEQHLTQDCKYALKSEKQQILKDFRYSPCSSEVIEDPELNQIKSYNGSVNKNKLPHGEGILQFKNGSKYEGCFYNGEYDGFGIYIQTHKINNSNYKEQKQEEEEQKQQIDQNSYNQKDDQNYQRKEVSYKGMWEKGQRTGKGRQEYINEDWYEGQWKDNSRHGEGIYRFKNGMFYKGQWDQGTYQGKGIMMFTDGSIYQGDWVNGKEQGQGEKSYRSGEFENFDYVGEWFNGQWQGNGMLFNNKGEKKEGYFEEGKFVSGAVTTFNNKGELIQQQFYKGELKQDKNCQIF